MKTVNHSDLHHQFILSSNESTQLPGWNRQSRHGYCLILHPSLPAYNVLDKEGDYIGSVLGWPIDQSGKLVHTDIRLPFLVSGQTIEDLEKAIYAFGGRYAFVVLAPDVKRVYLDAGGTLSAVYWAKRKVAGSTVSALVLDEPDHPLWSRPLGEFPDNKPDQYWPAGTTLDPDIGRILPNHYLDLVSWQTVRHYPKHAPESMLEQDVPDSVQRLTDLLRRHILAVAQSARRTYMPLTSGRDSRMLLACSRDCVENVDYVTFDYRPWRKKPTDRLDLYTSRQLARRFGLRHTVIPISPRVTPSMELEYLHRIGFAGGAGKSRDFFGSCKEHLDLSGAWLTGFAGEVGRAFYWRPTDDDHRKMSADELLGRMRLPSLYRLQNAIHTWLQDLPDVPLSTLLDFVYLEHRLGCWAAPHFYGAAPFTINLTPFNHREIFDIMLRLPATYRRGKMLSVDIILAAWPKLLDLPFNEYPRLRRLLGQSIWLAGTKQKARSAIKRILIQR